MRTAYEIASEFIPCTCDEAYKSRNLIAPDCPLHSFDVESAINEARKEAINECATKATAWNHYKETWCTEPVNKQSILALLKDLE